MDARKDDQRPRAGMMNERQALTFAAAILRTEADLAWAGDQRYARAYAAAASMLDSKARVEYGHMPDAGEVTP